MLATSLPVSAPTPLCSVCSNLQRPFESVVGKGEVVGKSNFEFCIPHFPVIARSVATWQSKLSVLSVDSQSLRSVESVVGEMEVVELSTLRVLRKYRIG